MEEEEGYFVMVVGMKDNLDPCEVCAVRLEVVAAFR